MSILSPTGKEYNSATAFVITFLVNNHLDKSKNGPAEAWEKAYIAFMKDYVANVKSDDVTIAFSSEVKETSSLRVVVVVFTAAVVVVFVLAAFVVVVVVNLEHVSFLEVSLLRLSTLRQQ